MDLNFSIKLSSEERQQINAIGWKTSDTSHIAKGSKDTINEIVKILQKDPAFNVSSPKLVSSNQLEISVTKKIESVKRQALQQEASPPNYVNSQEEAKHQAYQDKASLMNRQQAESKINVAEKPPAYSADMEEEYKKYGKAIKNESSYSVNDKPPSYSEGLQNEAVLESIKITQPKVIETSEAKARGEALEENELSNLRIWPVTRDNGPKLLAPLSKWAGYPCRIFSISKDKLNPNNYIMGIARSGLGPDGGGGTQATNYFLVNKDHLNYLSSFVKPSGQKFIEEDSKAEKAKEPAKVEADRKDKHAGNEIVRLDKLPEKLVELNDKEKKEFSEFTKKPMPEILKGMVKEGGVSTHVLENIFSGEKPGEYIVTFWKPNKFASLSNTVSFIMTKEKIIEILK